MFQTYDNYAIQLTFFVYPTKMFLLFERNVMSSPQITRWFYCSQCLQKKSMLTLRILEIFNKKDVFKFGNRHWSQPYKVFIE